MSTFNSHVRPRRRHEPGVMNKTETAYALELEVLRRADQIRSYRFEAIKFRLADRTFYTPDFMVVTNEEVQFHEVKGFWEEDARVKIKVVAEMYPEFAFIAIRKIKGGRWEIEEF
jgi:hypothetical protein